MKWCFQSPQRPADEDSPDRRSGIDAVERTGFQRNRNRKRSDRTVEVKSSLEVPTQVAQGHRQRHLVVGQDRKWCPEVDDSGAVLRPLDEYIQRRPADFNEINVVPLLK